MQDFEGLLRKYEDEAKELRRLIYQGRKILIVTHIDADGLTSGSIVFLALLRKGANVTVRAIPELDNNSILDLAKENYDFYIFVDLASTLTSELESKLGNRFMVIDHHQMPDEYSDHGIVINSWQFGYDGGKDACSATMAYFFAYSLDERNKDLSHLAVIGALADRQDNGEGRSLTGLNRRALEDAQSIGYISITKDLLIHGRETRPIHEAIAMTYTPFIPGLSGNREASLSELVNSGVKLKADGRWRTLSELSNDEKMKVIEMIVKHLGQVSEPSEAISYLIGEVYTLEYEDPFTPLRDAREYATLLNACGRMGKAGVGIAICLGDRGNSLEEGIGILTEYRARLSKAISQLLAQQTRIESKGEIVFVRAEDIVDEKLLGPVTSILASMQAFKDKVIVAMTKSGESELKLSSRIGEAYKGSMNLGILMREAARAVGGTGGGHIMAAGAKIPYTSYERFNDILLQMNKIEGSI